MPLFTVVLVALVAALQRSPQLGLPCVVYAADASQDIAKDRLGKVTSGHSDSLGRPFMQTSNPFLQVCALHSLSNSAKGRKVS
jgi:hypothetical protein